MADGLFRAKAASGIIADLFKVSAESECADADILAIVAMVAASVMVIAAPEAADEQNLAALTTDIRDGLKRLRPAPVGLMAEINRAAAAAFSKGAVDEADH